MTLFYKILQDSIFSYPFLILLFCISVYSYSVERANPSRTNFVSEFFNKLRASKVRHCAGVDKEKVRAMFPLDTVAELRLQHDRTFCLLVEKTLRFSTTYARSSSLVKCETKRWCFILSMLGAHLRHH